MSANWQDRKVTFEVTLKLTSEKVSEKGAIRFSDVAVSKGAEVKGLGVFTPKLSKAGEMYVTVTADKPETPEVPEVLKGLTPENLAAIAAFIQNKDKPKKTAKKKTAKKS